MFQNLPLSFFQDGTWNDNTCENPHSGFICKAPKTLKPVGTAQADLSHGCSVVSSVFLLQLGQDLHYVYAENIFLISHAYNFSHLLTNSINKSLMISLCPTTKWRVGWWGAGGGGVHIVLPFIICTSMCPSVYVSNCPYVHPSITLYGTVSVSTNSR